MSNTFFSYEALESQRSSGYKNTAYALAEIIDNSFDADATRTKIIFFVKKDGTNKYIDEIIVADDGAGMNKALVAECLQFGKSGCKDIEEIVKKKRKGRFGYGLPNASLSQCPEIHIFSWQESGAVLSTYLSLPVLQPIHSIEIPEVEQVTLPEHYVAAGAVLNANGGTIVSWRKCDRLSHTRASTIIEKSIELLGSLYRHLLKDGKIIELEIWEHNPQQNIYNQASPSEKVLINDPLFLTSGGYIDKMIKKAASEKHQPYAASFGKFILSTGECTPTNQVLADYCAPITFSWKGKKYDFEMTTSYAFIDVQKPGVRDGGNTPVGRKYALKDHISFVRADREISSGDYGFYLRTEPQNRWWTIEVKFNPDADLLLGVHNNKQGIEFTRTEDDTAEAYNEYTATLQQARHACWVLLSKHLNQARKAVYGKVREQGAAWDAEHAVTPEPADVSPPLPESTPETTAATIKTDGQRPNTFTADQITALQTRLAEKFPNVQKDEILKAITRFDERKVRGCVLYCPSDNDALWSWTPVFTFLIVLINTKHQFYQSIMLPLRVGQFQAALASIELFISSLAWQERENFGNTDERMQIMEEFRSLVGIHLNRYLRDSQIEISESDIEILSQVNKGQNNEASS